MNNSGGRGYNRGGRGGRGRGRNRGNRNRRNNNRRNNNNYNNRSTKKEYKFHPQTQGKTDFASFQSVLDEILGYVQKTWDDAMDIVKSVKKMDYEDLNLLMPARELSTKTIAEGQELDQQGLDIRYKEDYRAWKKRVEAFDKNKPKFYKLLQSTCSSPAQQTLVLRPPKSKSGCWRSHWRPNAWCSDHPNSPLFQGFCQQANKTKWLVL